MEQLDTQIPVGSLVAMKSGNPNVMGIIIDVHSIRAWITEPEESARYKYIYKIRSIDSDHIRYCYSYEMVIIST
jgi:hypothetical protein